MQLKVSLIVPVYNANHYIERCLQSLTEQTWKNIEIIIVDDGSTDGSNELCQKFKQNDARVCVLYQKNAGVVSARNTGIEYSSGDYLMFVDADDWIERDMVEELVKNIRDADIISSAVFEEKYPGKESITIDGYAEGVYGPEKKSSFYSRMIFDLEHNIVQPLTPWLCNKLYKRELVCSVYQSVDPTIRFAEDVILTYKCFFKAEAFVIIHKPFYHYCYNETSVCHTEQRYMLMDINKVYMSLYEICHIHNEEERLLEQLQTWIILMTRVALNERMHLKVITRMPEFMLDTKNIFGGKKLILYGAGHVGQDIHHQLKKMGYDICLWIDSNYSYWQSQGLDVHNPENVCIAEYDLILIAVSEEKTAEEIKASLTFLGVEREKILWERPVCI